MDDRLQEGRVVARGRRWNGWPRFDLGLQLARSSRTVSHGVSFLVDDTGTTAVDLIPPVLGGSLSIASHCRALALPLSTKAGFSAGLSEWLALGEATPAAEPGPRGAGPRATGPEESDRDPPGLPGSCSSCRGLAIGWAATLDRGRG